MLGNNRIHTSMITIDELRKLNGRVTYHALGTVKLNVGFKEFWHFYSDKTPVALDENIHSHPYSYDSKILFGGIRHHIYDVIPTEEKRVNSYKRRAKHGSKVELDVIHENIDVLETITFDTYKDDTYYINHSTLHKIELITPKCVTYLKAQPWQDNLFFVVHEDWNMTRKEILTQKASNAECWEIIEYTLNDEDNC